MGEMIALSEKLGLVNNYKLLAKDYGLFAEKVLVEQPGGAAREFLVFSMKPLEEDFNAVAILNRNERNTNLFYPDYCVVEMAAGNPLMAWEKISKYLGGAELLSEAFYAYHKPVPKSIRVDELEALREFYCNASDESFDAETRKEYLKGLEKFFKEENPKGKFQKEWREFYRSELFDGKKNFRQNFATFLKRNEPETSLDVLYASSTDVKKVYLPEHHYREFREMIMKRFPGVKYAVSDVRVVDKGIITDPITGKAAKTPWGQTVSFEEYDEIFTEGFASQGYACVAGLTPSYYEGRDIIYKASDEAIVASVGLSLSLRWAKCSDLQSLKDAGELSSVEIPMGHMQNFYLGMKMEGVPFYIDNAVESSPKFETVRIVYNKANEKIVHNLLVGLTMAQVALAHVSCQNQDVAFDIDVRKVDSLIQQAQARSLEAGADSALYLGNEEIEHN